MNIKKFIVLATAPFLLNLPAIAQSPLTEGRVDLNVDLGYFHCQLKVSNLPQVDNYRLLLNKGMNVKFIKDSTGNMMTFGGFENGTIRGKALEYYFTTEDYQDTLALPSSFYIEYTGAFPNYDNEVNNYDWKGVIAITEQTLRATEQTKWYPVVYFPEGDELLNSYRYDIEISLAKEGTMFLNGSPPVHDKSATFKSEKPVPLFLFAGDYETVEYEGNYILNGTPDENISKDIFSNIELIKNILSKKLHREFSDKTYLISYTPIKPDRARNGWAFNVYPAFAFAGLDFSQMIDSSGTFSDYRYASFAHELSHNYFGYNVASGPLSWFWLESLADFVSMSVSERISGRKYLIEDLVRKAIYLTDKSFPRLDQIESADQIDSDYRYVLGPLIMQVLEDKIGRDTMNRILIGLLNTADQRQLYLSDIEEQAIDHGVDPAVYQDFKRSFISNDDFKANVINYIQEKYSK